MSLCAVAAGIATVIASNAFTLSWEHSVEKVRWEEDWRITASGLEIVEARVKGSGAGMDPPDGSILEDGWWVYRPRVPPQRRLVLAASGETRSGWSICAEGKCVTLGEEAGEPVVLEPCNG